MGAAASPPIPCPVAGYGSCQPGRMDAKHRRRLDDDRAGGIAADGGPCANRHGPAGIRPRTPHEYFYKPTFHNPKSIFMNQLRISSDLHISLLQTCTYVPNNLFQILGHNIIF